jgi:transcriptional regulator with XRE-family HTH domain
MDTPSSRGGRNGAPKTRLDQLFRDSSRETRRELHATEVAAAMSELGEPVTDTYLRMLRYGPRPFNPSDAKRRALATVLGGRPEDLPAGDAGRTALDKLWQGKLVAELKEPGNREVSEWMRRHHNVMITPRYIQQLRDGVAKNPSAAIVNALAAYFGVPMNYLLDQPTATTRPADGAETQDETEDDEVRLMSMRLFGVSPQGRAFIASVIDDVRRSEKLDPQAEEG